MYKNDDDEKFSDDDAGVAKRTKRGDDEEDENMYEGGSDSESESQGGANDVDSRMNDVGVVDISYAQRTVWLVKVPDFLAERLAEIDEDNSDIGGVRIYANPNGPAKVLVHLSDEGPCADLPKEFHLQFVKKPVQQQIHMFCESPAGEALMIRGKVEQECQLKPILNEEYRNVMKQRNIDSNRPRRMVQVVESGTAGIQVGLIPHVNEAELLLKKKRKFEPDLRKERLPKAEVMDLVFKAFEKFAYWSLKGLVDYTQQPTIYLKEVLAEICVFNKRGPYKNLFELRPEYKRSQNR